MNAINHEEATKNLLAEQYLLGELTGDARDSYEEHLFSCPVCFEQVKTGTEFVSHLRQIGPEKPATVPGFLPGFVASFKQPVTIAALGLFIFSAGISLYQHSVITQLKAPRAESRYTLVGIAHGSGGSNVIRVVKGSGLSLNAEYARNGEFVSYQAGILSDSGKNLYSIALPEKQIGNLASIDVPAETLKPGQYSFVVFGRRSDGTQEEVGHSIFELQFTEN